MSTIVKTSNTSTSGYEIVIDGVATDLDWVKSKDPRYARLLALPENPANRKYLQESVVLKNGGEVELTYRETRTIGPRGESTPRKPLEEYMSEEDKATYLAIIERAKKAREEACKKAPLTELEKAMRTLERLKAKVRELGGTVDGE